MSSRSFVRESAPARRVTSSLAMALLCSLLLAPARDAAAGACGDDVGGERVPCACGDLVVSDTVLWPTDPVATEPCSGDGLVLEAPFESDGITLNLGGQTIVGTGSGAGIRVTRGGKLGSVIVGGDEGDPRAEIANFDTGIRASGRNILREIRSIDLTSNRDDGLKLHASGVRIEDVRAENNGRHGASLTGHGLEVSGVVTDSNGRDGLQVRGAGATIEAQSSSNGGNGAVVAGRGNRVTNVTAAGNGRAGVLATGEGHRVDGLQVTGNEGGELVGRPGAVR